MDWTLQRTRKCEDGIFGTMTAEEPAIPSLVSLEHAFKQPDGSYAPAVPAGTYLCERRKSPEFGYEVFQLMNVPGHDWVEIHIGNFNADSKACVLLGEIFGENMILRSKSAFESFMASEDGAVRFYLTIKDPA